MKQFKPDPGFLFGVVDRQTGVPTVLEVLSGALVPSGGLVPNPAAWTQPAFFIDPANSTGKASDSNDGATALTPVLSYNGGVVAKWGTVSPVLKQTTTLTWLSSQPVGGGDPVICTPTMVNAVLILQGTTPTVLHSGVLAGVTPKNRNGPQLLQADVTFAATQGQCVQNTTPGKESRAYIYKNVALTVFSLSQPLATTPTPPPFPATGFGPAEVDTWANGDSFELLQFVSVNLVLVQPTTTEFVAPNFPWPLQVFQLHATTADGVIGNANCYVRGDSSLFECTFDSLIVVDVPADDETSIFENIAALAGVWTISASFGLITAGMYLSAAAVGTQNIAYQLANDVIIDTTGVAGIGALAQTITGDLFLQSAYIAGEVGLLGACNAQGGVLWGPGSIDLIGMCRLAYNAGTAAATFLLTGGLTINGLSQAWTVASADPAPWRHLAVAAIVPFLDAVAQYNGIAIVPGGGAVTSRGGV